MWFIKLFGLDEYGESGMTRTVKWTFITFAILLLSVFSLETWAWSQLWQNALKVTGVAFMLALIFASVMTLLDRAIITYFTSERYDEDEVDDLLEATERLDKKRMVQKRLKLRWVILPLLTIVRLGIMYAMAHYTAVPVVQAIMADEIEKHIVATEQKNKATNLAHAKEEEEKAQEELITKKIAEVAATKGQTITLAGDSIEKYKQQRTKEWGEQSVSMYAGVSEAQAAEKTLSDQVDDEGRGAHRGIGSVYNATVARHNEAVARLDKLKADLAQAKDAFDKETGKEVSKREQSRSDKMALFEGDNDPVEKLRREKEAKIKSLRSMSPDDLKRVYGQEEWKLPRGYLASERALEQMEKADPTVGNRRTQMHLLFVLFTFAIMFLKWMLGVKLAPYQNPREQAKLGSTDAQKLLGGQGVSNFVAYARPLHVQKLRASLLDARAEARVAFAALDNQLAELCKPDQHGNFKDILEIQAAFHNAWATTGADAYAKWQAFEHRAADTGYDLTGLPEAVEANSRYRREKPWTVTEAEASEFNWQDQATRRDQDSRVAVELQGYYTRVDEILVRLRRMYDSGLTIAGKSPEDLRKERLQACATKIEPLILQIERLERKLQTHGQSVPQWSNDPRPISKFWNKDEASASLHLLGIARREFDSLWAEENIRFFAALNTTDKQSSLADLRSKRALVFVDKFLSKLMKIRQLETSITDSEEIVPEWTVNPGDGMAFYELDVKELRKLGWEGPSASYDAGLAPLFPEGESDGSIGDVDADKNVA